MAKNMARLDENNIVINIEWVSDNIIESDLTKEIYDYPVIIGDSYKNSRFYRNDELILTPLEEAYLVINEYNTKEKELNASYQEGINSI